MTTVLLTVALVTGAAGVARADGWWKACDSDMNPSNGSHCECQGGSSSAASIGTWLGLMGLVAYRIGRKRRRP